MDEIIEIHCLSSIDWEIIIAVLSKKLKFIFKTGGSCVDMYLLTGLGSMIVATSPDVTTYYNIGIAPILLVQDYT
jgi:hypothetical protein